MGTFKLLLHVSKYEMYFHIKVKFQLLEHIETTTFVKSTNLIKGLIKLYNAFVQIVNTIKMIFIILYSTSGKMFHITV